MVRIVCLLVAFEVVICLLATMQKKHRREILWAGSIILFLGLMLGIGFQYITFNTDDGNANWMAVGGVCIGLFTCAILALGAEKLHAADLTKKKEEEKKAAKEDIIMAEPKPEPTEEKAPFIETPKPVMGPGDVPLTKCLGTPLAIDVFSKAIKAGLMSAEEGHYK